MLHRKSHMLSKNDDINYYFRLIIASYSDKLLLSIALVSCNCHNQLVQGHYMLRKKNRSLLNLEINIMN